MSSRLTGYAISQHTASATLFGGTLFNVIFLFFAAAFTYFKLFNHDNKNKNLDKINKP